MKKLLTLLLVFSFAFSVSAVTHVPEVKAEKFLIEKSILKTDLFSVSIVNAVIADVSADKVPERPALYQHRFKDNPDSIDTKTEFICINQLSNYTFYSKLPDKLK